MRQKPGKGLQAVIDVLLLFGILLLLIQHVPKIQQATLAHKSLPLISLIQPLVEAAKKACLQLLLPVVLVAEDLHILQNQLGVVVELHIVVITEGAVPVDVRARALVLRDFFFDVLLCSLNKQTKSTNEGVGHVKGFVGEEGRGL